MILDDNGDLTVDSRRGSELRHRSEVAGKRQEILEVQLVSKEVAAFNVEPVPVRPLPEDDSWFETAWAAWSEGEIYRQ